MNELMNDANKIKTQLLYWLRQLEGAAMLMRENNSGRFEAVFVSKSFARMLESNVEDVMNSLNTRSVVFFTHRDDRLAVRRMLRRRVSEDSTKDLTVRQVTSKGNVVWCNVNFTFLDELNEHYIYCTFFDVTSAKVYAQRLQTTYMSIGNSFYRADNRTLSMFRANLTRNKIEDIQGRDLFGTDSVVRPYSELISLRSMNYPIAEEREFFWQRSIEKISRHDFCAAKRNCHCIYFHGARTDIIVT